MSASGVNPPPAPAGPREWQPPRLRETALWIPFVLIKRHPFVFLLVFGFVLVVGTTYIAALPRSYESRAGVLVRIGNSDPAQDLGVFPSDRLYEITVNNEIEAMRTDDVLMGIVAKLEPEVYTQLFERPTNPSSSEGLRGLFNRFGETVRSWSLPGFPSDDPIDRITEEDIAKHVRDHLWIHLQRGTSVIALTYRAPRPELAQQMLESILREYQRVRSEYSTGLSGLDWLGELRRQKASELQAAEQAVVDFSRENGLIDRPGLLQEQVAARIVELTKARDDLVSRRAGLAKKHELLDRRLNSRQKFIDVPSSQRNERIAQLRSRIDEQEDELLSGRRKLDGRPLSAEDRERIRGAIAELEKELEETPVERDAMELEMDPNYFALELEVIQLQGQLADAEAQVEELDRQLEIEREEHARLQSLAASYSELARRRDEKLIEVDQLYKPLQKANLAVKANESQEAGIAIIEKPTLPNLPSKPRRTLLLAGLFAAAVLLALLASFLVEGLHRTVSERASSVGTVPPWMEQTRTPVPPAGVRKL